MIKECLVDTAQNTSGVVVPGQLVRQLKTQSHYFVDGLVAAIDGE